MTVNDDWLPLMGITEQFTDITDSFRNGQGLAHIAMKYPPDPYKFLAATEQLNHALETLCALSTQLNFCKYIILALRSYWIGEHHFFRNEYALAAKFYEDAIVQQRLLLDHPTCFGYMSDDMRNRETARFFFYQAELIECQAIEAARCRRWQEAIKMRQREKVLCQRGLDHLKEADDHALTRRLLGHFWFAEQGRLEALAQLAAKKGRKKAYAQYMQRASKAGRKSVEVNPIWTDYVKAERELREKAKSLLESNLSMQAEDREFLTNVTMRQTPLSIEELNLCREVMGKYGHAWTEKRHG